MHSNIRLSPAALLAELYYALLASMPSHFVLPMFGLASKTVLIGFYFNCRIIMDRAHLKPVYLSITQNK